MSAGTFLHDTLRWVAYPVTMAVAVGLCVLALRDATGNLDVAVAAYGPVLLAALGVVSLEQLIPHRAAWQPNRRDIVDDALFMLIVQILVPRLLGFAAVLWVVDGYGTTALATAVPWPTHWGLLPQVMLVILVADLLRYTLHRLCHTWAPLWRLHAVHHAPGKLYWLNVGRFHPLEEGLQFVFDALPFLLLGVSESVLALYFVFYAVNGFFQHANTDVRLGWLNYVVSGPELHRWHHSLDRAEANHNFGNNIILWDLLLGTYYLPANRTVTTIGVANRNYPTTFAATLWTPFFKGQEAEDLPPLGGWDAVFNVLVALRMCIVRITTWPRWLRATRSVERVQDNVLRNIVTTNQMTRFGADHRFATIRSYADWVDQVPVSTYEDLARYMDTAAAGNGLTAEAPVLYQVTSGTTGSAKYLPITPSGVKAARAQQNLFAFARHLEPPTTYAGKVFAVASPAIEGRLLSGVPFGSASGLLYQTMPLLARRKYVVPYSVFEIDDYDSKYRTLALLAAANTATTAAAAANPSTFLRILDVLNTYRGEIAAAIASGGERINWLDGRQHRVVSAALRPDRDLAEQLQAKATLEYPDIWPHLQMLATWTGGSCGIALSTLASVLPERTSIVEMGYLASEFRGTITVGRDTGVPTLTDHFFEFARPDEWDAGERRCLRLHELTVGERYYVIVTTANGLYRYFINDIVQVDGMFNNSPTLRFVQKGRGVTSITGEKLCEYQVIQAMRAFEERVATPVRFYQFLADEETACYRMYVEADLDPRDAGAHGRAIDALLGSLNIEYAQKRRSGRLLAPRFALLAGGTAEAHKRCCLSRGQREGQFKTVALMNLGEAVFPFEAHVS